MSRKKLCVLIWIACVLVITNAGIAASAAEDNDGFTLEELWDDEEYPTEGDVTSPDSESESQSEVEEATQPDSGSEPQPVDGGTTQLDSGNESQSTEASQQAPANPTAPTGTAHVRDKTPKTSDVSLDPGYIFCGALFMAGLSLVVFSGCRKNRMNNDSLSANKKKR